MIRASCPGNLMILGEHAVLRGYHAIVMGISQRLTITLRLQRESQININSALGNITLQLNHLEAPPPFHIIARILSAFHVTQGLEIKVTSEFSDQIGFGSSACMIAALSGALTTLQGKKPDPTQLFHQGLSIIREIQGMGSGADLAASLFGGMLMFRTDPFLIQPIPNPPSFTAVYTGYKTPTPTVAQHVATRFMNKPDILQSIDKTIDAITCHAARNIHDLQEFGICMNMGACMMDALGVQDATMTRLISQIQAQRAVYGVKPSGSGLGDCLICLGELDPTHQMPLVIPVQASTDGLLIEVT